jgi:predicted Zn-dependent peptidase
MKKLILLLALACGVGTATAQGLKAFKLSNGLSVFVWEDSTKANVYGMIGVRAGSYDDPEEYTGLAHYLEHVLFKGTQKIGALDWEKEKPLYEQIIAKYDEAAPEQDPLKREAISKEINELTLEASKISLSNEFSSLTQSMGGVNLNAFTSFDQTAYHNSFPPGEVNKWLDLNSERLINPIFRAFQPELETVYEEYNMYRDEQQAQVRSFLMSNVFQGSPYARDIIGLGEHLKNPRLSQLIKFYNDWYVPENMALILAGNVKVNDILPAIKEKFGRLPARATPERKEYPGLTMKGRKEVSAKVSRMPQLALVYPGAVGGAEDEVALEVCISILSNATRTGLLDKKSIDGDVITAYAYPLALKREGRILVAAVPYYDVNQRRFESLSSVEKMLLAEIKKLKNGEFDQELLDGVKGNMIRQYDLSMESNQRIAIALLEYFTNEADLSTLLGYRDIVAAITIEQVQQVAQKYFGNDYISVQLKEGKPKKGDKIKKPDYKPIEAPRNAKSDYAQAFEQIPAKLEGKFADMSQVQVKQINDRSKLYYTKNPENKVFTLTLKYGIGTGKMPKLELAAMLMDNAGIMGQYKAEELKKMFSNLSASCSYNVDESYLYITMEGFENYLAESCNLLTRQILLPQLDNKQLDNLKGQVYQSRMIEKNYSESLGEAMREYLFYREKSEYLDRLTLEEIIGLSISNLTGEIQRATDYEAEIHYVGGLSFDSVYNILSANLPLKQGEKASASPEIRPTAAVSENVIYFLPDNDAKQSTIHFYVEGDEYNKDQDVVGSAFNQYFSGGFNGLVIQEIREYRSMAYSTVGVVSNPSVQGHKSHFWGYIGTQSDKTVAAVEVFMNLLLNMPEYPERMENIKSYLVQTAYMSRPDFRDASRTFVGWQLRGYKQSPAQENLTEIQNLSFDDVKSYYEKHIKGRKVVIGIVGNPKNVNLKSLEKYGRTVKLSSSKVFSSK